MKPLSIVIASAEAYPYVKVGGLGDVVGALPREFTKMGHKVTLFLPLYRTIDIDRFGIKPVKNVKPIPVDMAGRTEWMRPFSCEDKTGFKLYFIENSNYFSRDGVYTDPKTGRAYPDDGERWTFFARGIIEAIKALSLSPDVVHCNDYQTALVPVYIKEQGILPDTRTIFSIHNIGYQGKYDPSILSFIGVGKNRFYPMSPFEFYGRVNFMKLGIEYADRITTVSPTYAEEIKTPEYGYGLEGLLSKYSHKLSGILNGIDYDIWKTENNPNLPFSYTSEDLSGKRMNKLELIKELGLPKEALDLPMLGIITRLAPQKGIDILEEIFPRLMMRDITFVLLGTGEPNYEEFFEKMALSFPKKVSANIRFDIGLSHRILAGSDILLIPSRYEPCGLTQMFAMHYGTVPVARKTGGLTDTITDFTENPESGTGFLFEEYDPEALLKAINRAITVFEDYPTWRKIMIRGMRKDFSWHQSAKIYTQLYTE